jgi:hypothetical protein
MGIFKPSDPEIVLQKSISAERALRDELDSRLVSARKIAEVRQHEARKAVRDLADDKTLQALEDKQVAAERRVQNLIFERDDSTERLADLERQLAHAVDQRQRKEEGDESETLDSRFAKNTTILDKAFDPVLADLEEINRRTPNELGFAMFLSQMRAEIPAAVEYQRQQLRGYIAAVRAGGTPAILPRPVPPQPLPQPAPTTSVLSAKPIRWHDAAGDLHIEPKWKEVSLPVAVADRAVKIGAAVRPGHELWAQRGWQMNRPKLSDCIDNDDPDAPVKPSVVPLQTSEPDVHSAFEKPTVGPAFTVRVPRNESVPATATRNLPSEDKDK